MSDEQRVQGVAEVGADHLLASFAHLAQETGLELTITLFVRGQALAGRLIGRDRWLEELAALGRRATGSGQEDLIGTMQEAFRIVDLQRPADQPHRYGFVHLTQMQVLGLPPTEGRLWRGRISEVSGWSFGA